MLKVSQRTEYAMRAMLELAVRCYVNGPEALVPARALAEAQHIPLRFLEQQMGALHKAGLVESFRGAGGGCRLASDPENITVAHVVDAIEGPQRLMNCLDTEDHTCFQDAHCGIQELWGDVSEAIRTVFVTTTLAELAERHRRRTEPFFAPAELIKSPEPTST